MMSQSHRVKGGATDEALQKLHVHSKACLLTFFNVYSGIVNTIVLLTTYRHYCQTNEFLMNVNNRITNTFINVL